MRIELFRLTEKYKLESLILLIIFSFTWLGFGNYTAGLLALAFLVYLFIKEKRLFLLYFFKDKIFITILILFTVNNVISSMLSIEKLESTILSLVFFLVIFIPISYVRFSLNKENEFFVKWISPAGLAIFIIILLYLFILFLKTTILQGFIIKRYTFYFLGKATTPDILVILGGIGYGWIRQKKSNKYLWIGFIYLLLGFVGVILTYDRGGVLAFFVLIVVLLSFDYKRLLVFITLIAIFIAMTFILEPFKSFQNLFNYLYLKSSQMRLMRNAQLATFRAAWGIIKDNWFIGVGTNNFSKFSEQYGTGRWYAYAHNFVLQFWAENGLFGMIFGLSIIGLVLYRWIKSWKLYKYNYTALGVGVSFIGMLIGNLTNSTIWIMKIAVAFWLLAGAINAIYYIVQEEKATQPILTELSGTR